MSDLKRLYESITSVLSEIINIDENLLCVLIATRSGQLIDYVASKDFYEKVEGSVSFDELAATIAAMYGASLATGTEFSLGDTDAVLTEFTNGRIVIISCGNDALLAITSERNIPLGNIRLLAKKFAKRLSDLVEKLFVAIDKEIKMTKPENIGLFTDLS